MSAIKRIPTYQGLDGFQNSLHPCDLDESIALALEGLTVNDQSFPRKVSVMFVYICLAI